MRHRHLLLLATTALMPCATALAAGPTPPSPTELPTGPQTQGGGATYAPSGSTLTINQFSQNLITNWQTFNIGSSATVNFLQPNASAIALNRVTGDTNPSQIMGTLTANGIVFLVNPNGVIFGKGSTVNAAGFLATTHDIKNSDFMAGKYNFTIPGNPTASIVNFGNITATSGGFAALVAPGVRNDGVITAQLGTVGQASSGQGFTLDMYGDKLITLAVNDQVASQVIDVSTGQPLTSLVANNGTLSANGGKVQITAAAAKYVVDSVINNKGVIEANAVAQRGGTIVLAAATAKSKPAGAPAQNVKLAGTISAAGQNAGQTGGTIKVTGENISMTGAKLDASGQAGGGAVNIGGKGTAATATNVAIDTTTTIDASATRSGDGGNVVVWSDQLTTVAGLINARGGTFGGNGGFVETSGGAVNFAGIRVDTSASAGKNGMWLVDPTNLTVDATAAATIVSNLATTSVTLQTNADGSTSGPGQTSGGAGDIIVNASIGWSSGNSLTLSAYHDVVVNASVSNSSGANVTLRADNSGTGNGTVTFGDGGNVSTAGQVSIFYNPSVNPAGSIVNASSYVNPIENYLGNVTGGGTLSAYMLVNTINDLQNVQNNLGGTYALGRTIDATVTAGWNGGAGFVPIGNANTPFTGTFDGNGNIISNLMINLPSSSYVGLFGLLGRSGRVENLGVVGGSVSGSFEVGGLIGGIFGTVTNTYATDAVTGGSVVGGLIGGSSGSVIQSYATGTVTGNSGSSLVSGLIGANGGGTVIQSYAIGMVSGGSGSSSVGGLIGGNGGTATSSYWNTQTSGQTVSDGGTGLTTAQFQAGLPSGFDPTVWRSNPSVNNGYPYLFWQLPSVTPVPPSSGTPGNTLPPTAVVNFGTQQLALLTSPPTFTTSSNQPLFTPINLGPTGSIGGTGGNGGTGGTTGSLGPPTGSLANGLQGGNGAPLGTRLVDMPVIPLPPGSGLPPPGETRFVANELVLQFGPGVSPQNIATIASQFGLTLVGSDAIGFLSRTVYRYAIPNGQTVVAVIRAIEALRMPLYVEPEYNSYRLTQDISPSSTTPGSTELIGDPAQYVIDKFHLGETHRLTKGDNVVVGVIDSEIDANHPDLAGVVTSRYDAGCGATTPDAHGTGMTGAIAARKNLMGVAPNVKIIAICAFGGDAGTAESTSIKIIKGLDFAIAQGARVINMSFAGPRDPTLAQALQIAREKGILLVSAAGNAGPKSPPLYPGADPNVIAVTATDDHDRLFKGANQGNYIAIAAPGVDILVPAPNNAIQLTTGTSVATAHVSGVAALLLAQKPKLTPEEMRKILVTTAKHLGAKGAETQFGAGLVDPLKALRYVPPQVSAAPPAGL